MRQLLRWPGCIFASDESEDGNVGRLFHSTGESPLEDVHPDEADHPICIRPTRESRVDLCHD